MPPPNRHDQGITDGHFANNVDFSSGGIIDLTVSNDTGADSLVRFGKTAHFPLHLRIHIDRRDHDLRVMLREHSDY